MTEYQQVWVLPTHLNVQYVARHIDSPSVRCLCFVLLLCIHVDADYMNSLRHWTIVYTWSQALVSYTSKGNVKMIQVTRINPMLHALVIKSNSKVVGKVLK